MRVRDFQGKNPFFLGSILGSRKSNEQLRLTTEARRRMPSHRLRGGSAIASVGWLQVVVSRKESRDHGHPITLATNKKPPRSRNHTGRLRKVVQQKVNEPILSHLRRWPRLCEDPPQHHKEQPSDTQQRYSRRLRHRRANEREIDTHKLIPRTVKELKSQQICRRVT